MNHLNHLWQSLESLPGLTAVAAHWREILGNEYPLVRSLLHPLDRPALSYPRGGGTEPGSRWTVVEHGPNDFVGVSPETGETTRLATEDVILYRFDLRKLGSLIADVINLQAFFEPVGRQPWVYRIGSYIPFACCSFPAYFVVPTESSEVRRAIQGICALGGPPFVLLLPTRRLLRSDAEELLNRHRACLLLLSESVEVDGTGKWQATEEAIKVLERFRRLVIPEADEDSPPAFFPTPAGSQWSDVSLRFLDGETLSIKVRGVAGNYLFSELGMMDRRAKKPDVQWELLRLFARGFGVLTWKSVGADRKNQKRKERLSAAMQQFFRIEGDPIAYDEEAKGWKTLFSIEPDV